MIGPFIDMQGAVDVHVHSEPDLFPRIADDVGVARHARGDGAAGDLAQVPLGAHHEPRVPDVAARAGDPDRGRHRAQPRGRRDQPGGGRVGAAVRGAARLDADRRCGEPRPHLRQHRRLRQAVEHGREERRHRHRGIRRPTAKPIDGLLRRARPDRRAPRDPQHLPPRGARDRAAGCARPSARGREDHDHAPVLQGAEPRSRRR